jgi:hypothetical protein
LRDLAASVFSKADNWNAYLSIALGEELPSLNGKTDHIPSKESQQQIQEVLDNYAKSVTTGDRALFESQLLDEKIPFFGLGGKLSPSFKPISQSLQGYAGFRKRSSRAVKNIVKKFRISGLNKTAIWPRCL